MRLRRWASTAWFALLGVAAVTASVEYLPHTDDGCTVEIHCLACRTSLGRMATAATVAALPAPGPIVEWILSVSPRPPQGPAVPLADSRGPPLA